MKTFTAGLAAWLLSSGAALAQAPALPAATRADAHFVVGWQNIHKDQPESHYNDWINGIFYGGAGAGWYWNDHLKTQVDVGAGTRGRQYTYSQRVVNGLPAYETYQTRLQQTSVAVSQQYQFFRNQWFHPRVGAGLDIARESVTEEYQPLYVYDNTSRTSRLVSPARTEGPEHRMVLRPFGEVGFKAYMTRRAFFTGDTRLMFRGGVDEVLFRLGFGVDF
jgi:hypothetical protein